MWLIEPGCEATSAGGDLRIGSPATIRWYSPGVMLTRQAMWPTVNLPQPDAIALEPVAQHHGRFLERWRSTSHQTNTPATPMAPPTTPAIAPP
jgi:hypothetical protein